MCAPFAHDLSADALRLARRPPAWMAMLRMIVAIGVETSGGRGALATVGVNVDGSGEQGSTGCRVRALDAACRAGIRWWI